MITEEQAIDIARQELAEHGFKASDYTITIEPHQAEPMKWMIWFELKGTFPVPGGKHAVSVDQGTGDSVFLPGE